MGEECEGKKREKSVLWQHSFLFLVHGTLALCLTIFRFDALDTLERRRR
jgi:hypothetical protein